MYLGGISMTSFKYYVSTGTCIGKYFDAPSDEIAKAWARGYADGKGWKHYKLTAVFSFILEDN